MRLIGLTLLISQLTLAATCPVRDPSVIEAIAINTKETSCDVALDMAKTLTQVSQQLNLPIKLSLSIVGPNNNAGFDDGEMIEIPSQYIYRTGYQQTAATGTLSQLQTIVIHEFGHALLSQKLKTEFTAEFKNLFDGLLLDSRNRLQHLLNPEHYPKAIEVRLDQKELARYLTIFNPYSELFADTVAVYFTNDPSALLSALYFDNLTLKEFHHLQLRDFKTDHKLTNPELEFDPHSKLAPTRSFIGKNMMVKTDKDKQRMIRILMDAILVAIRHDLQLSAPPDAATANQFLIALLKAAL